MMDCFEQAEKIWLDYILPDGLFVENSSEWEFNGPNEIFRYIALSTEGQEEDENTIKAVFRISSHRGLKEFPMLCVIPSGDIIGYAVNPDSVSSRKPI